MVFITTVECNELNCFIDICIYIWNNFVMYSAYGCYAALVIVLNENI